MLKKLFLLFLGTVSWSWVIVKSGWMYSYGLGFWGSNGHDGIWHLALIESLVKGSWSVPVFAGEILKNYHVGFDLLVAVLNKVTQIPVLNLYFQIIPPVLALLIGTLTYKFVFLWTKSKRASLWSIFFVYFGGSLGWILGKGESAFWSQQSISTLINPPFALSLVILLLGLISLVKEKKLLSIILFGILISIKSYAGLLALGALLVSGLYEYYKNKKIDIIHVFFGSLVISLTLYLPLNRNASNLLVWQPFWFLETMMGLTDRIGWLRFASAMSTYKSGHIWLKGVPAYLVAFGIFWVGNMGTRLVKEILVLKWIRNFKSVTWVEVFISSIIMAGGVVPMFFLQQGTPWNTIQFFYYSLFFSGILAGVAMLEIKNKLLITLIVLTTIPTTIITLKEVYVPMRPPAKVANEEIEALKFLSTQPDGVVLTYPFDKVAAREAEANPPRPLYLYESTAYVSAFSKHTTYLEDEVNLDITGYDWKARRGQIESWYKESDQVKAREFLKENRIKYIYWVDAQRALLGESQLGLEKIYENNVSRVYRVIIPSN